MKRPETSKELPHSDPEIMPGASELTPPETRDGADTLNVINQSQSRDTSKASEIDTHSMQRLRKENSEEITHPETYKYTVHFASSAQNETKTSEEFFQTKQKEIPRDLENNTQTKLRDSPKLFEPRDGPDQILPATSIKVWEAHHPKKLLITSHGMASDEPVSVHTMLKTTATKYPEHPALAVKRENVWRYKTYHEYFTEARTVAKAFIKLGLERFKGVCIMGFNSPEWFIAKLGAIFAGGLSAGVYLTNSPDACRHIAENCMAQVIVIEDAICLKKFLVVKRFLPNIKAIVQWSGVPGAPGVLSWAELIAMGLAEQDNALEERLSLQAVNQCCNLVYTSGTTGPPKGAMCSQDSLTWSGKEWNSTNLRREATTGVFISYLPLSHISAQLFDIYLAISSAATVYFAQPDALKGSLEQTLLEVQPTFFITVPRMVEKIHEKLLKLEANEILTEKSMADWALDQGYNYYSAFLSGRCISSKERTTFSIAKKLFLDKARASFGLNRCHLALTGTAPIPKDVLVHLISIGIPIGEGASMSETGSIGCSSEFLPGQHKLGSIGKPLPQINLSLRRHPACKPGEGEIVYKGRSVCMGYLRMPEKTNEAIDDEGYLYSGDIGRIDEDGFVYITGRIKEIIITAGGENIPPKLIEFHIKREIPFISSAFVVGDRRKYLTILLTLSAEQNPNTGEPLQELTGNCQLLLKELGSKAKTVLEALAEVKVDPKGPLAAAIQQGIDRYNREHAISNAQRIQRWTILPEDFSMYNGELTNTLKVIRANVLERYKDVIDEMYKTTDQNKVASKL